MPTFLDVPFSDARSSDAHALDDDALRQAVRHHCRAIEALQHTGFDGLRGEVKHRLLRTLRSDLAALQEALRRRSGDAAQA